MTLHKTCVWRLYVITNFTDFQWIIEKNVFLQVQGQIVSWRRSEKDGQGTKQCSMHYICYDLLYGDVLSRLQYWYEQEQHDEGKLLQRLLNTSDRKQSATKKKRITEKSGEA